MCALKPAGSEAQSGFIGKGEKDGPR